MKKFAILVFASVNLVLCVPSDVQKAYEDICWNCYNREYSIQNFLNRYEDILRDSCGKDDAQSCAMIANLYSKMGNPNAKEYWQKACKLGQKEACTQAKE